MQKGGVRISFRGCHCLAFLQPASPALLFRSCLCLSTDQPCCMGPTILGLGQILLSPICTVLSTFCYLFLQRLLLVQRLTPFHGLTAFTKTTSVSQVSCLHKKLELETDAVDRWFTEHFGDAAALLHRLHH